MTLSSLISSLRTVQNENTKAINRLSHLRQAMSTGDAGAEVLYGDDLHAIRSYQNQGVNELVQSIRELQQLNGKIDDYINRITQ